MKKTIRYCILVPVGMVFTPFFALGLWMNPVEMYQSFFDHLKSGESFGIFD